MVKLSASRIKTFESCSWSYYCKYVQRFPDKPNSGSLRGTLVHLILECLSKQRHYDKYYDKILKDNSIVNIASIMRLCKKYFKKNNLLIWEDDFPLVNQFIIAGLKFDWHFDGSIDILDSEKKFDIKQEKYHITGFIDRMAIYKDKVLIRDYKTSKQKLPDVNKDPQSLMYLLACKHLYPDLDAIMQFLFLKYKRKPLESTNNRLNMIDKLNGFEEYLKYLSSYLTNFSEKKAYTHFAKDSKSYSWQCKYTCPFKSSYYYWAIIDTKTQKVLKNYGPDDDKPNVSDGEMAVRLFYGGCPAFKG